MRVFLHKFTQKLYEKMKSDLSATALDLLFRLDSPAQEISHFSDSAPLPGESFILPQPLAERHRIHALPQRWTVQHSCPTYDIYENRLLKQFLQRQLTAKLEIIQERAEHEKKQREASYARYHNSEEKETIRKLSHAIAACQEMKQRCIQWSSDPFSKPFSPLLSQAKPPRYCSNTRRIAVSIISISNFKNASRPHTVQIAM